MRESGLNPTHTGTIANIGYLAVPLPKAWQGGGEPEPAPPQTL